VVLLDYAENVCTATVVARYPARTPVLAELAPVFTAAKWLTLTSCFVLLVVGLGAALVAGIRRRRSD
jgi:ABC-type dipeptide/oligopeptide/nickel transport system permease component